MMSDADVTSTKSGKKGKKKKTKLTAAEKEKVCIIELLVHFYI